ncbi:MAG: SUMF1/EgtB/PvdO family nonheme iron enzyme, partial [Nitrospinae bacterium]|nr:SUMF1/EgtB/PvdO family nonheme iron enzyme [Nitrospinota bacterium]
LLASVLLFTSVATAASPDDVEIRLQAIFSEKAESIDLTETLLLISQDWNPSLDTAPLRAELDRLTESARKRLHTDSSAKETVDVLREVIHREGGYRYTEQVDAQGIPLNPDELFLHGMLKTKRGYCMNLSLLYLILGERLNLPLYGVGLPNHFFVRYESGTERINIEATELGATFPDSFYENRFGLKFGPETPFFTQSLNKKQTLGAYLSNVGMAHYRNSQTQKAIFYLKLATGINPSSIEAHNNLANIHGETGQHALAVQHYQQALRADPNSAATLFNLGLTYVDLAQPDKAIEAFLQVTQIEPSFASAHRQLARLYLSQKKYMGALLHLKQLVRIDPGDANSHVSMGKIYNQLGQLDLAVETLNRAKSRFPRNTETLEALAEAYYRMEDFDRAVAEYRFLIERKPQLLTAYIQLGWVHYRKGEFRMATAWTRRGLKLGTKTDRLVTLANMNLGLYAWMNGNHSDAKAHYREALKERSGEVARGILQDLEEAATQFPDRAEVDFFAGWVYHESGEKEKEKARLNRYLNRAPSGELAAEARSLLGLEETPESTQEPGAILEDMVLIPAGFFIMGSNDHGEDEAPAHSTYLDAYSIDRYEVSATNFAAFLNEVNNVKGYYFDNKYGTLYFDTRFHARKGLEDHPINNVKWAGAHAYCRWEGKRLPTEAEWEKAARGTDERIFPWGNIPPNPGLTRFRQVWTEETKHHVMVHVKGLPEGASFYGVYNMAGNVKEWVDDWFDREYYKNPSNHINPKGQIGGEFKVLRGGSWRDLAGFIYSSFRNNNYPNTRLDDYGFRCAKSTGKEEGLKQLTQTIEPRQRQSKDTL